MEINEPTLDQLNRYTVAIQKAGSNSVLGTGVIVTEDGLIVTCYHVVGNIKTKTLDKTVDIYFPELKSIKPADIVEEYCTPSLDIAFLKLKEDQKLPDKIAVANLGETVSFGHKFASMGFRKSNMFEKLSSSGEIRIKTSYKSKESVESPSLVQLYSDEIERGMSGAPVLDLDTNKVIGIISDHYDTEGNVDAKLNFAIPIQSVIKVYPDLMNKNSGLLKIHQFMQAIEKSGSLIYDRFEDVYVPPIEYKEIRKILEEYRCIFITGTPEYGKTYTAIKLLWEYYKGGYTPKYIDEGSKEAIDIIKKLVNLDKKSLENNIIYIEDPVGKTEYKANKEFEESIGSIISSLGNLNVYLIVTMREEIYHKFNPIGKKDLEQYIKKLNIANDSYDFERRKEILLRWAEVMNCNWLQDEKLKNIALESIKNEARLPTPLNIKDFVFATNELEKKMIINENELLGFIDKKSQRTPERFAREIEEMYGRGETYKIVFLCFPFISDWFSIDFVKTQYNEILKYFNIKDDYAFERVHVEFQDKVWFSNHVTFSHPSYSEALSFILVDRNNIPTKINTEIFSNLLIKLSSIDYTASAYNVASAVSSNFDKLPENVRNELLVKLADNEGAASAVASAVSSNFDKLPENVRNELLVKLADNEGAAGDVSYAIASNFDKLPENVRNLLFKLADNKETASAVANAVALKFNKLPENVRNELLVKLANKGAAAAYNVASAIAFYFDKLPENVRNLLFKLADNKGAAYDVASAIAFYSYKAPENVRNLLFKLADNKETDYHVANAVSRNFDKLPVNVRNELLVKLADKEQTARDVARTVSSNFDKLPENVRNLLFKLADNEGAAKDVASAVSSNFDKLPENVRNELLVKLADNEGAAGDVASAIAFYFDKLPENVRNELLVKLADNKEAAYGVASAVSENFDKLPENVRNLLFKLADNEGAAKDVASAIAFYFDKLPENVRNLLFKLIENKETAYNVASSVSSDFDKLPENVRNLLFKLADNKETAYNVASSVSSNFDKLPENVRNELLVKLADKEGAAYNVASAVSSNFDKLPENVRNLLFKLADNKETASAVASAVSSNFDKLPENVRNELLVKLADNKEAAYGVASAVSSNFDKLPENVRNLLFKLADNKETASAVANAVALKFNKLPENVRNELLVKLADNKGAAGDVASAIAFYFDKLPENVRNLLFKLIENKETAEDAYLRLALLFDELPENVRDYYKLAKKKETAKD